MATEGSEVAVQEATEHIGTSGACEGIEEKQELLGS